LDASQYVKYAIKRKLPYCERFVYNTSYFGISIKSPLSYDEIIT